MNTEISRAGCVYWSDIPLVSRQGCLLDCKACEDCASSLQLSDSKFVEKWQDQLQVFDRTRKTITALANLLAGRAVFLLCGGPSTNELPLEQLNRRGVWTMCVNNVAGHAKIRPQAMVCSDPPKKFSHSIWLDPAIMKFVPIPKLKRRRGELRQKINGQFAPLGLTTAECPNVWGFQRYSWFWPDYRFFTSDGACWGNHQAGCDLTGQSKTVNTMLLALRLLCYLGAKTIFLLGVDFRMTPESGYSFSQERTAEASVSNNNQFKVVNEWFCEMVTNGTFSKFGVEIFNCNPTSGLRAFPYVPFSDAINITKGIVEDVPDLAAWYDSDSPKENGESK